MPSLITSVNIACDVKKEAISKDDMKVMARTLLGNKLSRMEADAIFDVFDLNKARSCCHSVLSATYMHT